MQVALPPVLYCPATQIDCVEIEEPVGQKYPGLQSPALHRNTKGQPPEQTTQLSLDTRLLKGAWLPFLSLWVVNENICPSSP